MGQSHLYMFPVDYMSIQGSLVLDILSLWLCLPVDLWGVWIILNTILIIYQAIFKLVTKELSSSVIHNCYWPWIPDQPCIFHQVHDRNHFIFRALRYFKTTYYGVYNCNDF